MKLLSDIQSEIKAFNALKTVKVSVLWVGLAVGSTFVFPKVKEAYNNTKNTSKIIEMLGQMNASNDSIKKVMATKEDLNNLATKEDVSKAINKTGGEIMKSILFVTEHQDANKEIILDYLNQQLEVYKPIGMTPMEPKIYGVSLDTLKKKISI